jgi:hypothetical protein
MPSSSRGRREAALVLAIVVSVVVADARSQLAQASGFYNRAAAHSYADSWSSNTDLGDPAQRNPAYVNFGNDCTNFVSQVMRAGGYPDHNGSYNDCSNVWWFNWYNPLIYSNSWVNASCMNYFASNHPGDFSYATYSPYYLWEGDFFLMDLEGHGYPTHARVIVGSGFDVGTGLYTTLIDQHTNDRKHRAWDLELPGGTPIWSWHIYY